jgi:hypothetical protein
LKLGAKIERRDKNAISHKRREIDVRAKLVPAAERVKKRNLKFEDAVCRSAAIIQAALIGKGCILATCRSDAEKHQKQK